MNEGRSRIADYIRAAGLQTLTAREADVERAVHDLVDAMAERPAIREADSLYTYRVPMLTEDGTCSVADQMAPVPYDLAPILGGRSEQTTRRLALLREINSPWNPRLQIDR